MFLFSLSRSTHLFAACRTGLWGGTHGHHTQTTGWVHQDAAVADQWYVDCSTSTTHEGTSEFTYYGEGIETRKKDGAVTDIGRLALNGAGQHPEWSDSDVAEIIIYRRHLSDEERGRVEDYLSLKYGLCVGPSLRCEWSYVKNVDVHYPPSLSVRLPPPVTVNKVPRIARIVESCHEYTMNTNAHALVSFDADVRPVARIAICFDKKSTSEKNYDYLQLLSVKAESKDD